MGLFDLFDSSHLGQSVNGNINIGKNINIRIPDIAEKIGGIFGEEGKEIGRKIDEKTKDCDININL